MDPETQKQISLLVDFVDSKCGKHSLDGVDEQLKEVNHPHIDNRDLNSLLNLSFFFSLRKRWRI